MKASKAMHNQIGFVNSLRLHVYSEPTQDSDIVCKLRYLTEVEIDYKNSTEEFYKICTAIGAEGFCQKDLVTIK
jgi:uncharacterized protein YgiM (DUF1202 family)